MTKKRKWRTRTTGTAAQRGQHFIIDDESMQAKKNRLPAPSLWIRGLHRKSDEEKLAEEKRKRLKELAEKKKHEKRLMGQPIPEEEPKEGIEEVDEQIRAEAGEVKKVVLEIDYDVKTDWHKLSNWLQNSRVGRFLTKKKDES